MAYTGSAQHTGPLTTRSQYICDLSLFIVGVGLDVGAVTYVRLEQRSSLVRVYSNFHTYMFYSRMLLHRGFALQHFSRYNNQRCT